MQCNRPAGDVRPWTRSVQRRPGSGGNLGSLRSLQAGRMNKTGKYNFYSRKQSVSVDDNKLAELNRYGSHLQIKTSGVATLQRHSNNRVRTHGSPNAKATKGFRKTNEPPHSDSRIGCMSGWWGSNSEYTSLQGDVLCKSWVSHQRMLRMLSLA